MSREVVVTGLGAVSPLGISAEVLFRRWCAGENALADGLARCSAFDPLAHLSRKETRRIDRFAQLALAAAEEACLQAGWPATEPPCDPFRVACAIGTGIGGAGSFEAGCDEFRRRGGEGVNPLMIPRVMGNAAAAWIAMRRGIHGPAVAVNAACASGAEAIATGTRLIRSGEADAVIAGGTESALSPVIATAFRVMGALSPTDTCRPFDARRDGFVLGEAASVLVLEAGDAADRRAAPRLGRVLGVGRSSDASHLTAPDPTARLPARAISAALADADLEAGEVEYVNAHGTATRLNDRVETMALKLALGDHASRVKVSSVKSAIGHTFGAAGAIEAAVTLIGLRAGVAPPTLGYEQPEEGLDLDYVAGRCAALSPRSGERRRGLSNSFGFGGHNVVLALEAP